MSTVRNPYAVKLFCGLVWSDASVAAAAEERMTASFGEIDFRSPVIPFNHTDYYRAEMGSDLQRTFVTFASPIDPGVLAEVKQRTNAIEIELSRAGDDGAPRRRVNLDPGYVTPAKLVLATGKDFAHRIYLRDGIYAEVTLMFGHEGVRFLPWTYPDFKSEAYVDFFTQVRGQWLTVAPERSPDR